LKLVCSLDLYLGHAALLLLAINIVSRLKDPLLSGLGPRRTNLERHGMLGIPVLANEHNLVLNTLMVK